MTDLFHVKKIISLIVGLSAVSFSGLVSAQSAQSFSVPQSNLFSERYIAVYSGLMELDYGEGVSASTNPLELRGGVHVNDNLAIELRLGLGITGESVNGVDLALKNSQFAMLKFGYPVGERVFPYVAAGLGRIEFDTPATGSETELDGAYGFGMETKLDKFTMGIEYFVGADTDEISYEGVSFGLRWGF